MISDYISPNLLEYVLGNMKKENALAVWVSMETGMRIGDVLKLKPTDIDKNRKIRFTASKTGKKGIAQISKELWKELVNLDSTPEHLFVGRDGKKARSRQAVYKDMKKAAKQFKALDEKQVSPHTARKVFAVEVLKEKGISAAKNALQHSSTLTTLIYLVQGFEDRLENLEKKLTEVLTNTEKRV